MTNFINLNNPTAIKKSSNATIFNFCLDGDLRKSNAYLQPNNYHNVAFIGHDSEYGDVFKAWDEDLEDFTLFFGTKGDEFNS